MERLKTLPIGILVQDTDRNGYIVLSQNEEDTLLYVGVGDSRWVVAWNALTNDKYDPEELEKAVSKDRVDGYEPPLVSWEQGRWFTDGEEAVMFIQDRYMERTGKKMCHHAGHLPCQYYVKCRKGINCIRCGAKMVWENPNIPGIFQANSRYLENWDICRECMEDHCVSTNCYGCKLGEYPECRFLSMKKAFMDDDITVGTRVLVSASEFGKQQWGKVTAVEKDVGLGNGWMRYAVELDSGQSKVEFWCSKDEIVQVEISSDIDIGTRVLVTAFGEQQWGTVFDVEEEIEGENYSELGDDWMKYAVELDSGQELAEYWYSRNEIIQIED